jgi:Peptidase A4 family
MNIRPWLAGAVSIAAVTIGFSTSASAATTAHHEAPHFLSAVHNDRKSLHVADLPHLASTGKIYNTNWAGYIALADKNVALRYVAANFDAPSLNCVNADQNATATQLVGMGGFSANGELIGIQATCNPDGTYAYSAFYNIGNSGAGSTATINPGDAITASVYYNASTAQYTFYLDDVSTNTVIFNNPVACPSGTSCSTATAEAVTDVPYNGDTLQNYPLANYGMAYFTGGAVTSRDGVKGSFGSSSLWGSADLITEDGNGVILMQPSSLYGGAAFTTEFRSAT